MPRRSLALVVCLSLAGLAAEPVAAVSAPARKFNALVFPDRATVLVISDLAINETISNPEGDRFFVLHSPHGTFKLPFEAVADVEFTRYLGAVGPDTFRYEVRMQLPAQGERLGTIDLRVLRGFAGNDPWHDLLLSRADRGAGLFRILFMWPEE